MVRKNGQKGIRYSVDNLVGYPVADFLAKKCLCPLGVRANTVTVANIVLSLFIIGFAFMRPCNWRWILLLMVLRSFLDILDGTVARQCNDRSKLGHNLDYYGDMVFFVLVLGVCMYHFVQKRVQVSAVASVLGLLIIIFGIQLSYILNDTKSKQANNWHRDNSLVFYPLLYVSLFFLLSGCPSQ